jgi:hypothetical protein
MKMLNIIKKMILLTLFIGLSGCDLELGSSFDPTTRTLYLDHYREACNESSVDLCFRIRLSEEDSFALTSLPMTGFDSLEWGKRYTVQVEAERSDSGKDTAYRLQSIDQQEVMDPASNDFVLTFNMSSGILVDNQDNSWTLANEKTFACEQSDCSALENALTNSEKVQLKFSAENDELTLLAVTCQSSENNFSTDCEGVGSERWDIAHYLTDCGLHYNRWCYVYKESTQSSADWQLLGSEVTGFSFLWGVEYDIDATVVKKAGSIHSVTYEATNGSLEKTDAFKLVMRTGGEGLEKSDATSINYLGLTFDCVTNAQCNDIDDAIDRATSSQERILVLQARVVTSAEEPEIEIEDLICDAAGNVFKQECADKYDDVYWLNY